MIVELRDMSDFDGNEDTTGYVGATHKVTEGTRTVHTQYGRRLNLFRSRGLPVLGSYHVLRTPGNGGHGSLSSQLDYWLSHMDSATPWWRTYPHWILQVDLEKWPYDAVTLPRSLGATHPLTFEQVRSRVAPKVLAELVAARASTGMDFARLLVDSGVPGWKITYASHGQYGDALAGIATPLWNANYGTNNGVYPGDGSSRWDIYSGQAPVLLQYASNPYDKSAFRGSLAELLALIGGNDMLKDEVIPNTASVGHPALRDAATTVGDVFAHITGGELWPQSPFATLLSGVAALQDDVAALQIGGVDLDVLAAKVAALVGPAVHAELAKLGITVEP